MKSLSAAIKKIKLEHAGFTSEEIHFLGLMDKTETEICTFLSSEFAWSKFFPTLNGPQRQILNDKLVTQRFLESFGIKMPTLLGLWHPAYGAQSNGDPLRTYEQFYAMVEQEMTEQDTLDLFLKPRAGRLGKNVQSISVRKSAEGFTVSPPDACAIELRAFLAELTIDDHSHFGSADQGWIIQHKVVQHPDLAALNPTSLNTLRLVTHLRLPSVISDDESLVRLDQAFFRVGRLGTTSDGWTVGAGLLIDVDIADGRLSKGRFSSNNGGQLTSVHPDSQINFDGKLLPFWEDAIELCKTAALFFPDVRSIGWDVAITPEGPILVEGNTSWVPLGLQTFDRGYFTAERTTLFAKEGVAVPPTRLQGTIPAIKKLIQKRIRP